MSLRLSNLCLSLDEPEASLDAHVRRALGLRPGDAMHYRILRKALDARDSRALHFVYTVEATVADDEVLLARHATRQQRRVRIDRFEEEPFVPPTPGPEPLAHPPVVIGSGPGGLVAAWLLALQGYRPIVLERGRRVSERIRDVKAFDEGGPHDPESNYLFGEGGAGTFSDGKLTYRGTGPDVRRVLQLFAECKGKPSIVYDARPHLGSNRLPAVVKAIRQRIEALGGEVRFECRVDDLDIKDGKVCGLATTSGYLSTDVAVLAIGHSARDSYEMLLKRGVPMEPKAFQLGVRIEQPQETVNRVHYGDAKLEEKLGAASYSLVANGANDVFTFCMCAGGYVMPSVSEAGHFCTNGMSLSKHDSPFANSGLVVTLEPAHFGSSDVLAGVRLQRHYERIAFGVGRGEYRCPIQSAADYLAGRDTSGIPANSYPRGAVVARIAELVPPLIDAALRQGLPIMDKRWQGRFLREATLVGPESRGSAPVRIVRDERTRQTPGITGLYPVGEGAGYAGGIVSAAVDGLRSARAVVERYAALA